jgi:hypothetical protein
MSRTESKADTVLLRRQDAAEEYGFTDRQLRRWITEGKLAVVKPSGQMGPAYVSRDEMNAFIEAHTTPARSL